MRILLLFPAGLSITYGLRRGFEELGHQVYIHDWRKYTSPRDELFNTYAKRLPGRFRIKWNDYYLDKINEKNITALDSLKPDMVLVYNSQYLTSSVAMNIRSKAKLVFYLGDSPFYTRVNEYFLPNLFHADLVLSPDSHWIQELRIVGINNAIEFVSSPNLATNFITSVTDHDKKRYSSDLVFVGSSNSGTTGYKRALFLNSFADMDIRVYTGRIIKRWYKDFPKLESRVVHPETRISHEEHNTILNCCKIYPIDANPGLINGMHIRVFDCISSGLLPLPEYRKDIETILGKEGLPLIHSYADAASLAQRWLDDDKGRTELVEHLSNYIGQHYNPKKVAQSIIDGLEHAKIGVSRSTDG